jgi:hypothetical protein
LTVNQIDLEGRKVRFSEVAHLLPIQETATIAADAHKFSLFGGTRGPGKSYWLRWYLVLKLLHFAERDHFNVRVMLASESYTTLYDRHIVRIPLEFPRYLGTYHKGVREFVLHSDWGGGVIALRNLDDPDKYAGAEFAVIAVDELTRNKVRTFNTLRGSLRWPGLSGDDLKFVSASMPTGIGKVWVRELFIEKKMPEGLEGNEKDFVYIPGRPGDNSYLDESYWHMLRTLPEPLRKAWLDGDWYVTFEGLVYSNFSGEENLLEADWQPELDEETGLPVHEVELAFDDGYVDPRAILFIIRTPTEIFVFDEIYISKELPEASIRRIKDRMITHFGPMLEDTLEPMLDEDEEEIPLILPSIAVGSPEAKVLQRQLRVANIPTRKPKLKNVIEGISHVRQLIEDGNGYRTLKVHPRCTNFISELTEGYLYPEEGTRKDEEKPVDGNDHACDAFRYWASARVRVDR